jgi:hypothetical protein
LSLTVFNNKLFLGTDETAVWGAAPFGVLPISLQNFSASENGGIVNLRWQYNTAINSFEIQRSTDGQTFTALGRVNSRGSNYSFNDLLPGNGLNYYRLKITGMDGGTSYSAILSISIKSADKLNMKVTPNPAVTLSSISISGNLKGNAELAAYDASGRFITALFKSELNTRSFTTTYNFANWQRGIYILQLTVNGQKLSQKLIIQ